MEKLLFSLSFIEKVSFLPQQQQQKSPVGNLVENSFTRTYRYTFSQLPPARDIYPSLRDINPLFVCAHFLSLSLCVVTRYFLVICAPLFIWNNGNHAPPKATIYAQCLIILHTQLPLVY